MDEHAEHVSLFVQHWLPALPPLERLQAAEWASEQYVTALVHLEHSYGIGARLLLEAQQAATRVGRFVPRFRRDDRRSGC